MCRKTYKLAFSGLCSILITMIGLPAAFATTAGSAGPEFPSPLAVGASSIAVYVDIINTSTPGDVTGDTGEVRVENIKMVPACASSTFPCTAPEPAVFSVSGTGVGSSDPIADGCAGVNFIIDGPFAGNEYTLTPDATVVLGRFETCRIEFTVDLDNPPTTDGDPPPLGAAGYQTYQKGFADLIKTIDSNLTGEAQGTDTTTIEFCGDDLVNQECETCDGTEGCRTGEPDQCGVADVYACTFCGDGILQEGLEECDPAAEPGQPGYSEFCNLDCVIDPYCGDGEVNQPCETCDGDAYAPGGAAPGNRLACRAGNDTAGCEDGVTCTYCGDGEINGPPGAETCDDGVLTGVGNDGACRGAQEPAGACTRCGDGELQPGEACDDGNNANGDGCSASCEIETCAVEVDKQWSCTGEDGTWSDVELVTANDDGTNGPTCPYNSEVYVRYVIANTGDLAAECTLNESSVVVDPDGTVAAAALNPLQTETLNPVNVQCTDELTAEEPDTATLSCSCAAPSLPAPLSAEAYDEATIACEPYCGDGEVNQECETCDGDLPPNAPPGSLPCRTGADEQCGVAEDYACTYCGDGNVQQGAGETCDDGVLAGVDNDGACRGIGQDAPACTRCGDGVVQTGEACDDGNNADGDGCSASCEIETCAVEVDKQWSCDGDTWFDEQLVTANQDGTNGPTCPYNSTVYVRYVIANTGDLAAECTLNESNLVIVPGGTVVEGASLTAGTDDTLDPVNVQCTDSLTASEPDTATLNCECAAPSLPAPLSAQANDEATIVCEPYCGDGVVGNTPGETCDPPGSNAGQPDECRDDCTYCGDGNVDAGEVCDDGNEIEDDGCSTSCECVCADDGDPCTTDICDPEIGCVYTPIPCGEGCRTTGGGKQPSENTYPEVNYVTHGGQVGAPYGEANAPSCSTDSGFNSPCIRGEYQHTRHYKPGLKGVFHAQSNGKQHDFDSLQCACLPCLEGEDYTDIPSPYGDGHPADRVYNSANGTVDDLCNPDDRICGPEPRSAPANKICFSGVSDYAMNKGNKDKRVVFRVDLEDRSEPGGAHPGGAQDPPDRYRMRMWFIPDGADEDDPEIKALREAVACKNALDERVASVLPCVGGPVPAPDIDDGGDLDRGNRQIHPLTGATCTEE